MPESLEHYVWNTVHKQFYAKRAEWFQLMTAHHFVMWWIEEGHLPTPEEAKERLDHLQEQWRQRFCVRLVAPAACKAVAAGALRLSGER